MLNKQAETRISANHYIVVREIQGQNEWKPSKYRRIPTNAHLD